MLVVFALWFRTFVECGFSYGFIGMIMGEYWDMDAINTVLARVIPVII